MKKKLALCGIILLAKVFVVDFFVVSGVSMESAVRDKSIVAVNKAAYGLLNPATRKFFLSWAKPKKGDIVFFDLNGRTIVKRCAAVEGTPLSYSNETLAGGGFWLSFGGEKIPLNEGQYQRMKSSGKVPAGTILAVGDNYEKSFDSRNYGFVPVECGLGKAF